MLAYWQRLLTEWGEELDGQMDELQKSVEGMQRLASFKQTKVVVGGGGGVFPPTHFTSATMTITNVCLARSLVRSQEYLRPLFEKLKAKTVPLEMLRLLEELFHLMRHRKYLEATDRYVQLAIGNAPWPVRSVHTLAVIRRASGNRKTRLLCFCSCFQIGVTRVGIHERSAREKLQEAKKTLSANIMTDETTRKYLVCVKRLITFAQRKYPTDPSNSCEFNSLANGSDLEALTGKANHLRDDIQLPALQDFRDVSVRMWTN